MKVVAVKVLAVRVLAVRVLAVSVLAPLTRSRAAHGSLRSRAPLRSLVEIQNS